MQVYLVQPPIGGDLADVTPPLGILLLAAILEGEGHEVHVVDLNLMAKQGRFDPRKNLRTQLVRTLPKRSSRIDVVGVTTWSYGFEIAMEFVEAVKRKHPRVPIVLGGPHATFVDERVLARFPDVDLVLRDEADVSFPRLLRALKHDDPAGKLALLPGLTWRRDGEVVRNQRAGVVDDLDGLPYPAFHLVDVREYLGCQETLVLEAGRGCPYNCNFCSTTNMFQRTYRVKSPARLVDEVEWMMSVSGSKRFELLHDNLVANKKHVLALCREIRERNLDVDWSCTSRTDNMTEEVAQEMFLAGCVSVFYGVESMAAERQAWTGKRLKPPKVEAAVELTARQHLTPSVGIIIGFPDETPEELDATVGAAVRWTSDQTVRADVSTALLRYYPGADLFAQADALRYDPVASADTAGIAGYRIREAWREETDLFPLHAMHTPPEETERNALRKNFVSVLLKACPQTFRACVDLLGWTPFQLLTRATAERSFAHLQDPRRETVYNEILLALADVVRSLESEVVEELFSCEVPFWTTGRPVIETSRTLEHVVHPKRFEQESLLEHVHGRRSAPPERVEGRHIVAVRCGFENVVWFTEDPRQVLDAFQRHFARDPVGTAEFVSGLRQGL